MKRIERGVAHASAALFVVGILVSGPALQAQAIAGSATPANGVGSQFELTFWQSVAATDDRAQIEAYLLQYPNGTFSALARAKISAIDKREAQARGVAPAAIPIPASATAVPAPATASVTAPPVTPAVNAVPAPVPAVAVPPPIPVSPAHAVSMASDAVPAAGSDGSAALSAMANQLGALGRSQGQTPAVVPAVANVPIAETLPPRPTFTAPAMLVLPDHFCTAMDRNNFYDAAYKPAKDRVDENNRSAIAYLDRLKASYDSVGGRNDTAAMTQIAKESQDYQAIAGEAYKTSVAYDGLFAKLMAVPVGKCP